MATATLSFTLPEEEEEFFAAANGINALNALSEVDNYLRSRIKYEDLPEEVDAVLQAVRDKLHDECRAHGVEL